MCHKGCGPGCEMPWHPSFYERKAQADNIIGTLDDIIIDNQPKYLMLRESVRSRAKATIEFESWQHPSKKQPKVTVPVINTFRTPSSQHRDDLDSPDEVQPGSSSGLTGDDNFDKQLQEFEDQNKTLPLGLDVSQDDDDDAIFPDPTPLFNPADVKSA